MKQVITILLLLQLCSKAVSAQNFYIQDGTALTTADDAVIAADNCHFENNSNGADFSKSLFTMIGNQQSNLGGNSTTTFKKLTINKPAAKVLLNGDVNINQQINFTAGNLDLNGHIITLAPAAFLNGENSNKRLTGESGGYVQITVNMNNPNMQNPGNLGLTITSMADMGSVNIQRGHAIQNNNGSPFSISRHYAVSSSNGNSFAGTLRFAYFNEELGTIDESFLQIWSSSNSLSWINRFYTGKDAVLNFIESSELTTLEKFTISPPAPGMPAGIAITNSISNKQNKPAVAEKQFNMMVLPNIISGNQQAVIKLVAQQEIKGNIVISNSAGQVIKTISTATAKGTQQIPLELSGVAAGKYYISFYTAGGFKQTVPFIRN